MGLTEWLTAAAAAGITLPVCWLLAVLVML